MLVCMCLYHCQTLPTSSLNVLGKDICICNVLQGLFGGLAGHLVTKVCSVYVKQVAGKAYKEKDNRLWSGSFTVPSSVVLAGILGTKTYPYWQTHSLYSAVIKKSSKTMLPCKYQ